MNSYRLSIFGISFILALLFLFPTCTVLETNPSKSQIHKASESCVTNLSGCIPIISLVTTATAAVPVIPAPIMNIHETSDYASGSTYDFGAHYFEGTVEKIFTIQNKGTAELSLTGSSIVVISGTNADKFSIEEQPTLTTISVSSSTTFKVKFNSQAILGNYTANISIANNDSNNNPYLLNVKAEATNIVPP